jgi:hypothetical protein
MATAQSGQPVQVGGGDQLAQLAQLLPALFGASATQTTNPGNTQALQQLLAQLQGADYQGTLQSVFQQAAGQIPGMQQAFGNAVGARSGSNSSVEAALSQLMQQTAIQGQAQVANQQLQNQQIQANAGNAITQTTQGTTQTKKQDGSMKQIAGLLGLLQAGMKLTGSQDLSEMGSKFGIGGGRDRASSGGGTTSAPVPVSAPMAPMMSGASPVTSAAAPQMSRPTPGFDALGFLGGSSGGFGGFNSGNTGGQSSDFMGPPDIYGGNIYGDFSENNAFVGPPDFSAPGGMSMAPWMNQPQQSFDFGNFMGPPAPAPQMSFDPGQSSFNLMDFFR